MRKQNVSTMLHSIRLMALGLTSLAQLPDPGFSIDGTTAIVITDPQNDFLSPEGVAWGAVGQSVEEKQHH